MPEYSFDEMARYVRGRDRFDSDIRMDASAALSMLLPVC